MKKKIKVLGIAPYDGLRILMEQAAERREDIELTAVNGNLEEGRDIAKVMGAEYDVILSRANTADLISGVTHLPVVDIGISYYDVLRCLKQAQETGNAFAIIGFHALTSIARSLCELMGESTPIFTMDSTDDTGKILSEIQRQGYQAIVCDTVPYAEAKRIGLTPILLATGMENVNAAFDNAVHQYQNQGLLLDRIAMLQKVIASTDVFTLVMDCEKQPLFTANNLPDSELITERIYQELNPEFPATADFFINSKGNMYSVSCRLLEDRIEPYYVCHVKKTEVPLTYTKYGIRIMDQGQAETEFGTSFYSTTGAARELLGKSEQINQLNSPIMICGERGTGKDIVASLLYSRSRAGHKPLYIINCALINERGWKFVTTSYQSPFMDNDHTIYISNVEALSEEQQVQLLSIMIDTNLHNRNRILLSCSCGYEGQVPHIAMRFINRLSCFVLHLSPLREQIADIRSAAILYLDVLNQQLGKQVTSLLPDALQVLTEYSWPFNLVQFQRVLKEIIMLAPSQHVTADVVLQVLNKESRFVVEQQAEALKPAADQAGNHQQVIDLSQDLGQMTRTIVERVLQQHDGNQSAAAKHLGIGRTTMWRYLNHKE